MIGTLELWCVATDRQARWTLEQVAAPSEEEERRIFGESLPPGLSLVDGEPEERAPSSPG